MLVTCSEMADSSVDVLHNIYQSKLKDIRKTGRVQLRIRKTVRDRIHEICSTKIWQNL